MSINNFLRYLSATLNFCRQHRTLNNSSDQIQDCTTPLTVSYKWIVWEHWIFKIFMVRQCTDHRRSPKLCSFFRESYGRSSGLGKKLCSRSYLVSTSNRKLLRSLSSKSIHPMTPKTIFNFFHEKSISIKAPLNPIQFPKEKTWYIFLD